MVERVLQPVGRATWLAAMTHPDGEISFFNDAAFDIAPTLADVVRYADVIFAARQAQPIPAVIPAPSPVITATTAVISAGKPESNATPVIPAGKPESSAMDGKAAFNNHGAAPRRGPTIHFILLGDGARKEALKAQAANLGLTNVHFLDSVPKAEVPRYWSLLDVAIIHLRQADNFTQVIPSKLFECMGMGIPVLHGVAGESAGIVTREEVGLVFPPEDAQALRDGVLRLAEDPALYQRLKANCLAAAPRYERASLARQMLAVLEAVAGKAGTVSVTG